MDSMIVTLMAQDPMIGLLVDLVIFVFWVGTESLLFCYVL